MNPETINAVEKALDNLFKAAALANVLGFALVANEENCTDISGASQVAFDICNLLNEATEEVSDIKCHLQGLKRLS